MLPRRSRRDLHRGGQASAKNEVEMKSERMAGDGGVPVKMGDQAMARVLVRNALENGIKRKQRISGKIHLGDQARKQARSKERKVNVCRAPGIGMILPGISAGFYGDKTIAAFTIREGAAAAREVRIERRVMLVHAMAVAPGRVRLPNFNQRAGNGASLFIQNSPADDDAFALRFTAVLMSKVAIVFADVAMAENGTGELRQGVREQDQRLFRVTFAGGDVGRVIVIRLRSSRGALITGGFHGSEIECNWRGRRRSSSSGKASGGCCQQKAWRKSMERNAASAREKFTIPGAISGSACQILPGSPR